MRHCVSENGHENFSDKRPRIVDMLSERALHSVTFRLSDSYQIHLKCLQLNFLVIRVDRIRPL